MSKKITKELFEEILSKFNYVEGEWHLWGFVINDLRLGNRIEMLSRPITIRGIDVYGFLYRKSIGEFLYLDKKCADAITKRLMEKLK